MARGYMGKILNVDLGRGEIWEEPLEEELARRFVGGYGIGARLLFDRMPARVDPLGPQNILGFTTGPLTGSPCIEGNRFLVVCKSPLTDTWGDANCGGTFGPHLKFAGFDDLFFYGISPKPVYLYIENGKAELRDAQDLWGRDTNETEDILKDRHGREAQVASIGPSGERLSLIAAVINDKGRAAGRSGVGAVMGSKRLKAIVVKGDRAVPLANEESTRALRKKYLKAHDGWYDLFATWGTIGITADSSQSGDSPVKNWGGAGPTDFPQGKSKYEADMVIATYQTKKYGCWRCTMACGGHMAVKEKGPYQGLHTHKVEYETACAFGTLTLDDDFPSLIKANDLCNRYGLDTISAGATVAFAIECYENGLISREDTGGIALNWGNADGVVAITENLAKRQGLGDLLADGVKRAAQRIGRGADAFAIHIQGQEVPMHDPKFQPSLALTYKMDATPGRHCQGGIHYIPPGVEEKWLEKYVYTGRGPLHRKMSALLHVVNCAGVCEFGHWSYPASMITDFLTAVTGWPWDLDEVYRTGERISQLRHAFNLREGLNPLNFHVPGRVIGVPPLAEGPLGGISVDLNTMVREYCQAMAWDPVTCKPSRARLAELGLEDIAAKV